MHHDKKTGLAIAVLLIGAVAAFFFRNDSLSSKDDPPAKEVQFEDRLIEGENTPYVHLPGTIEEPESPQTDRSETASNANDKDWDIPVPEFFETKADRKKPSELSRHRDGKINRRISQNSRAGKSGFSKPIPIKIDKKKFGSSSELVPQHNKEWRVNSATRASTKNKPASSSQMKDSLYTIRSGDTLSGLAFRFLGSSGRYFEIYQANRDVIDNPDNLRPGTEIRIPGERQNRTKTQPVSTQRNRSKQKSSEQIEVRNRRPSSSRQTALKKKTRLDLQPKLIPARRRVYFRTSRWRKSKK